MEMKEKLYLNSEKDGKLLSVVVDKDMPLGSIFDALMEIKGFIVERMMQSHKEEEEQASEQMAEQAPAEEEKADG